MTERERKLREEDEADRMQRGKGTAEALYMREILQKKSDRSKRRKTC